MELRCDQCDSDNVAVEITPVRPHGDRLVAICRSCGLAWISTEPSVVEQVFVATHAARTGD